MEQQAAQASTPETFAPRQEHWVWEIATLAADPAPLGDEMVMMIGNQIIDNAGLAAAALNQDAVICARDQALVHPHRRGAALFGLATRRRVSPEWAAWANGLALHGADGHGAVPPVLAVAQHCGLMGADLMRGLAVAHRIALRHPGSHGLAAIAGIGGALKLSAAVIHRAVQRVSPSGDGFAGQGAALAGKAAVEALDWALRERGTSSPVHHDGQAAAAPADGLAIPFSRTRPQCVAHFRALADGVVHSLEQDRFLALVDRLPTLTAEEIIRLGFQADPDILRPGAPGLFDRP